jgi:endonuclease YncB( thermonuclease family)
MDHALMRTHLAAPIGLAVALVATAGCTPQERPAETQTVVAATEAAEVVAVVDGDTIDVKTSAGEARVRIIGIDTPEIGRDGAAGDCYAIEARDFLDELLYGRAVELRSDSTQGDADKYGRLLRHVDVDGQSAATLAIAAGAGYEYTYDKPYAGQTEHLAAEAAASDEHVGLWGACPSADR